MRHPVPPIGRRLPRLVERLDCGRGRRCLRIGAAWQFRKGPRHNRTPIMLSQEATLTNQPEFGARGGSKRAISMSERWTGVCECLHAFTSVCEHLRVFSAFCWERATEERLGRRVFDFQLIALRIEDGGGPGRLESAGGGGAEGWKTGTDGVRRARVESAAHRRGARAQAYLVI